MSKLSKKDEILLEYEARNELLQHFSSKSSNQAITILSVVLVFFAWVESLQYVGAIQNLWLKALWYVLPLELIFFVCLRAIGRLFFWGISADAIIRVKMKETSEYSECSLLKHGEEYIPKSVLLATTYHIRLVHACFDYRKELLKTNRSLRIRYNLTHGRGLLVLSLVTLLVLLIMYIPWGDLALLLRLNSTASFLFL